MTHEDEQSVEQGENFVASKVEVLQYLDTEYNGWTTTNEDSLLLVEGLKGTEKPGGFFAVGEFQNLDVALTLNADQIVLGDLDRDAVDKNLRVLQAVERSETVDEVLPQIFEIIEEMEGKDELESLKQKMTPEGADMGARVVMSWARNEEDFQKLKEMIQQGDVAVAQVDVTKPETMKVVGDFFKRKGTELNSAYLSNTISHSDPSEKTRKEHSQAVEALFAAGGKKDTLLIRSGDLTDKDTAKEVFVDFDPTLSDQISEQAINNRQEHYGKTATLPDRVDRIKNDNPFLYSFEFFTQDLDDYSQHVR